MKAQWVSEFIEDHEVCLHQRFCDLSSLAEGLLLLQGIDQLDRREEAYTFAVMFDGLDAKDSRHMRLSRTWPTPSRVLLRNTLPGSGSGRHSQLRP